MAAVMLNAPGRAVRVQLGHHRRDRRHPRHFVRAEAAIVNPITPDRFLDTRSGIGARDNHVGKVGGAPYAVTIAGVGSVPAGAKAVLVNVTAVGPDGDGFITVHQCGAVPGSSNLNFRVGQMLANLAVTALDGSGRACFTSSVTTDLIVDVVGWLGDTGLRFAATSAAAPRGHPRRPRRGCRPGAGANGAIAFPVPDAGILATVTAVNTDGRRLRDRLPVRRPADASNLNYIDRDVVANLVAVPPGQGGTGCVYTYRGGPLLVDRAGHPRSPSRRWAVRRVSAVECRTRSSAMPLRWRPRATRHLARGVALGHGLALVALAAALRQRQLHLRPAVLEVDGERHEREALLRDPGGRACRAARGGGAACAGGRGRGRRSPGRRRRARCARRRASTRRR